MPENDEVVMKFRAKPKPIFTLLGLTFVFVFPVIGYFQFIVPWNLDRNRLPDNLPDFLGEVWPSPNSKVSLFSYLRDVIFVPEIPFAYPGSGIFVTVRPINLDTFENLVADGEPLFLIYCDRTTLFIDGKEISKVNFVCVSGILACGEVSQGSDPFPEVTVDCGPFYMEWLPVLLPGRHDAEVIIVNRVGEIEKFQWSFVITIW